MKTALAATGLLLFLTTLAAASPTDDRYFVAWGGGASSLDVTNSVRNSRRHHQPRHRSRRPSPKPGVVAPLTLAKGLRREVRRALPRSKGLTGVVPTLAAKASEIVADCGSTVISGVRHTYVAGTGGRLSLHASGRAVDIKGNPACIMAHLRHWPGGVSTDYAAVDHTHISYAPHGPEWGARFRHHRGHRHRRHHHRRRA